MLAKADPYGLVWLYLRTEYNYKTGILCPLRADFLFVVVVQLQKKAKRDENVV